MQIYLFFSKDIFLKRFLVRIHTQSQQDARRILSNFRIFFWLCYCNFVSEML